MSCEDLRQQWLLLWGFVGQQYLADCRYRTLARRATKAIVDRWTVDKLCAELDRLRGDW